MKKGWFGDSGRHALSAFGLRTKIRRRERSSHAKARQYPKQQDPTHVGMKELFTKGKLVREYPPDASFEKFGKFKVIEEWSYDGYLYTIAVRPNGSIKFAGIVIE
jgi:hypothetical protein